MALGRDRKGGQSVRLMTDPETQGVLWLLPHPVVARKGTEGTREHLGHILPCGTVGWRNCYSNQSPTKGSRASGTEIRVAALDPEPQPVRACLKTGEKGLGRWKKEAVATWPMAAWLALPSFFPSLLLESCGIFTFPCFLKEELLSLMFSLSHSSSFPSLEQTIWRVVELTPACRMVRWSQDGIGNWRSWILTTEALWPHPWGSDQLGKGGCGCSM